MANRPNSYVLEKPVYLIGFMGAGKSSVGRYLSRKYGFVLVDADGYLEEQEGVKISQIFAEQGEERFRDLETHYLAELSKTPQIISTGGGVVKRAENRTFMKEHGFVIYLSVTAEAAAARIRDTSTRPLFKDLETAKATIAERAPWYEDAASAIVDTVGLSVKQISAEVFRLLTEHQLISHV